ncbi:unnamed protein product, partial [Prorocentrum cordatum]
AKVLKSSAKAMKVHSDNVRLVKPEVTFKAQWVREVLKTKDVTPTVITLPNGVLRPDMDIAPCTPVSRAWLGLPLQSPSLPASSVLSDADVPSGQSSPSIISAVSSS